MSYNLRRPIFATAIMAILVLTSLPGRTMAAVDRYWRGLASPNWSASFSWFGSGGYNALPNDGTGLVHFDSNGHLQPTSNVDLPWSIDGIEFAADAPAYTLTGSTLTIGADGIDDSSSVQHTINSDIVVGADQGWSHTNLVLAGDVSIADHYFYLAFSSITIPATGSMHFTGTGFFDQEFGTIDIDGRLD